jgi:hypothetical protein
VALQSRMALERAGSPEERDSGSCASSLSELEVARGNLLSVADRLKHLIGEAVPFYAENR